MMRCIELMKFLFNFSIEKSPDGLAKGSKPPKKSVVGNKRLSDSAPSSPKMPALLAQLQEPPLIPPSISIHAGTSR